MTFTARIGDDLHPPIVDTIAPFVLFYPQEKTDFFIPKGF
jgi:hypothetical protein